jgi:hypothetical protein
VDWKLIPINSVDLAITIADNMWENHKNFNKLGQEDQLEFLQICRNYGKLGKD